MFLRFSWEKKFVITLNVFAFSVCITLKQNEMHSKIEEFAYFQGRRTDLFGRDPFRVPITDFFGSVRRVLVSDDTVNVTKTGAYTYSLRKYQHWYL